MELLPCWAWLCQVIRIPAANIAPANLAKKRMQRLRFTARSATSVFNRLGVGLLALDGPDEPLIIMVFLVGDF
jgi:hypothetical protein